MENFSFSVFSASFVSQCTALLAFNSTFIYFYYPSFLCHFSSSGSSLTLAFLLDLDLVTFKGIQGRVIAKREEKEIYHCFLSLGFL